MIKTLAQSALRWSGLAALALTLGLFFAPGSIAPAPPKFGVVQVALKGDVNGSTFATTVAKVNGVAIPAATGTQTFLGFDGASASWLGVPRGYLGDGSDGTCTFDGTTSNAGSTNTSPTVVTLNRDNYCAGGSLSVSVTLAENGYRLFSNAPFALCGTIDNSGQPGAAGTGSGAAAGGSAGVANYIGGTSQAGAGGAAGAAGGSIVATGLGGAGGAGGGVGGVGGTITLTAAGWSPRTVPEAINLLAPTTSFPFAGAVGLRPVQGGAGGGGGLNTGHNGGGGGGGGAVVGVYLYSVTCNGSIQSKGGKGGNATSTDGPGGGGGGGTIEFVTSTPGGGSVTTSVAGGAAGTGGTGSAVAGSPGNAYVLGG